MTESTQTTLSIALLMLAGVGMIHILSRIWQTLADWLGSKRRADRDAALTRVAVNVDQLVSELREARKVPRTPDATRR